MGEQGPTTDVAGDYPHLPVVRSSITALHRTLPTLATSLKASIGRDQVALPAGDGLIIGVQHVARVLIRYLGLPDTRVIVSFEHGISEAGRVELNDESVYYVELNPRYKAEPRDIPAVLSHELSHVFLHRSRLRFSNNDENELLTDVAAVYLGVGWLLLDACRKDTIRHAGVTTRRTSRLGYLTPDEFGYVLAKRSLALGEKVDFLRSSAAKASYGRGLSLARRDHRRPPLKAAGRLQRLRYARDRRRHLDGHMRQQSEPTSSTQRSGPYEFDLGDRPNVVFRCPTCCHKLRLPVLRDVTARCIVCQARLRCTT